MKRIYSYLILISLATCIVACAPKEQQYANRAEKIAAEIMNPDSKYVVVACHRGDWRNNPENSIAAIESIIKMGADIMELDLKMTKDSVLILSHDKTIDRCTNGKGLVSDYTYDELMQFRVRRAHNVVMDTLRLITLREALECCKDRICVNVDQGYEFYDQVLAISEELGVTNQILIKGKKPVAEVAAKMAAHEHNMMYMPIVDIQKPKGIALFNEYMESDTVPLAYEVVWQNWNSDSLNIYDVTQKILNQGSKIWVNTLWSSLCGGLLYESYDENGNGIGEGIAYDDDHAYTSGNSSLVYDRYIQMGATMIQTDRPEQLLKYLRSKGLHD